MEWQWQWQWQRYIVVLETEVFGMYWVSNVVPVRIRITWCLCTWYHDDNNECEFISLRMFICWHVSFFLYIFCLFLVLKTVLNLDCLSLGSFISLPGSVYLYGVNSIPAKILKYGEKLILIREMRLFQIYIYIRLLIYIIIRIKKTKQWEAGHRIMTFQRLVWK